MNMFIDGFYSAYSKNETGRLWQSLFCSMPAKIQELMLKHDITQLQNDPTYTIDASNGVYLVFMIIGTSATSPFRRLRAG